MKLSRILQVIEVAKVGSMNKAAQNLFISQSNLSANIKELEQSLNISIFTRSHKGVELTETGKKFLEYSNTILENVNYIRNLSADNSQKGGHGLKVSSLPLLFVQDAFSQLCLKYSEGSSDFSLKTGNVWI